MKAIPNFRHYLSIMKPRVVFLLVLSSVTAYIVGELTFEAKDVRWFNVFFLIIAGFFSSGGANALNSWFDKDIDSIMNRTKQRPIPAGLIAPWKGLIYAITSILIGFSIAYFFLNELSSLIMLIGAVWYGVVYTMVLKRRTKWNIIVGGISGTFPVYAGWAAARGSLNAVFPFFIGLMVWTWIPMHFWSLAIRFREEYAAAKLPMLPVVIGVDKTIKYIGVSGIILMLIVVGVIFLPQTHIFFVLGVMPLCYWLFKHTLVVFQEPTRANSWKLFMVSNVFLMLVELITIVDSGLQIYFSLPPLSLP